MQQSSGSGGLGSDKARTISTNVDEKISSLQWRKEVLQRVQKLFEIVMIKVSNFLLKQISFQTGTRRQVSYQTGVNFEPQQKLHSAQCKVVTHCYCPAESLGAKLLNMFLHFDVTLWIFVYKANYQKL
jgi:hypothetical protein